MFAEYYKAGNYIGIRGPQSSQQIYTLNLDGSIGLSNRPLSSDLMTALNMPEGWSSGRLAEANEPDTAIYTHLLLPFE